MLFSIFKDHAYLVGQKISIFPMEGYIMSNVTKVSHQVKQVLTRSSGATIAYHAFTGSSLNNLPGIVFLAGFMSDMNGIKAVALEEFARKRGQDFVRFDYFGHGQSSGSFADGDIGVWLEDTLAVIDELTTGPQILVGSSMGGWLMLLAAIVRPERIDSLIGIAAAPDFTEDLLIKELTPQQITEIEEKGFVVIPSEFQNDYIFTKALLDSGRQHSVLKDEISIDCPVRLIHGIKDNDVPWRTALAIQEKLSGKDVDVILAKNGDHRLSKKSDLERLIQILTVLMDGL
jgi:pimeloyl-ACP methyl ester carboxylesterase